MPWDSDKSTAADPDNPAADEQLTADEWDAHVSEGHFPADEVNLGVDGNGDPVMTDPQNADEVIARYDRSEGAWVFDSVVTDDSVTVTTGEASDTLHYGSNQDRTNAGDNSVALGIGARANGDDGAGGSINNHVAVGYQAAENNTANNVTAAGYQAAQDNTGFGVTAAGYQAAENNTGFGVTAAGYEAAENNTGKCHGGGVSGRREQHGLWCHGGGVSGRTWRRAC